MKKLDPHPTNTAHFACFDCRLAFKQPNSRDSVSTRPFRCPECRTPMRLLGRYFKAPPRRAVRQWLKVELLYYFGEKFDSSRSGIGRACETLPEVVNYLIACGNAEARVRCALRELRASRSSKT